MVITASRSRRKRQGKCKMPDAKSVRHRIEVRLTEREWQALAALAQRMGMTMAGLLRMAALGEVERRRWLLEGSKIEGAARRVC